MSNIDFDALDNVQKYHILQTAKELLAYLNDTSKDFPYSAYIEGSAALQAAMAHVDDLIHPEPEERG